MWTTPLFAIECVVQLAERGADDADDDQRPCRSCEKVGRQREGPARLTDPAQVAVGDERDDGHRDLEAQVAQRREGGGEGICPGGCLHGDGHDVVDDQGDGGHLSHLHAEVVPGHDVRTAGSRVDHHDLSVGEGDEEQHDDDREGDRQEKAEGGDADRLHQFEKDLLGAVRGRRDAVRGKYAESGRLAEPLDGKPLSDERRAEQRLLQAVGERLREDDLITQFLAREPCFAGTSRQRGRRWRLHFLDCGPAHVVGGSTRHKQRAYFVAPNATNEP